MAQPQLCRPDAQLGCQRRGESQFEPASVLTNVGAVLCVAVLQADFRKAKEKVLYKKKEGVPEGLYM